MDAQRAADRRGRRTCEGPRIVGDAAGPVKSEGDGRPAHPQAPRPPGPQNRYRIPTWAWNCIMSPENWLGSPKEMFSGTL